MGGTYSGGTNPNPGGTLDVFDAMPLADRSKGTSASALALRESMARVYGTSRTGTTVIHDGAQRVA